METEGLYEYCNHRLRSHLAGPNLIYIRRAVRLLYSTLHWTALPSTLLNSRSMGAWGHEDMGVHGYRHEARHATPYKLTIRVGKQDGLACLFAVRRVEAFLFQ